MKINEMKNKVIDTLYENMEHNFENLDVVEVGTVVDIIKDLEVIEAMEGKEEHSAYSVYMNERSMNSLINYINTLSDEVHNMLRESPTDHKAYARQALSTLLNNV